MSTIHVEASLTIPARPETIYGVLSDYRVGHPAIVPKPYFSDITVLKGGQGAGTEITFTVDVFGTKRVFNQVVSEPEPGRVLMEAEKDGSIVTRFIVDPVNEGSQSHVTISTEIQPSPGVAGWFERFFVPLLNRWLYNKELQQIAAYVEGK